MIENIVSNNKAGAGFAPLEREARSIQFDYKIIRFVHDRTVKGDKTTRQIEIVNQFKDHSISTIREHLKKLCTAGILKSSGIRGSYQLCLGGYRPFEQDIALFTERLLGPELYRCLVNTLK